ncbi:hypothetical protein ACFFX0_09490 [Citricoccus parietis]|uniref:Uncharacterized protein n=1 Tax=Citricoccus parietis TaxID=592307 RepID=A0ABV5FXJ5_9MICC
MHHGHLTFLPGCSASVIGTVGRSFSPGLSFGGKPRPQAVQRPTRPTRLIRVSSISSTAVRTRAEAW